MALLCLHHELRNSNEQTWTERTTLFNIMFDCKIVIDIIIIITTHNANLIRVNAAKNINQVFQQVLGFQCIANIVLIHFIKCVIQINTECPKLQAELVYTFEEK